MKQEMCYKKVISMERVENSTVQQLGDAVSNNKTKTTGHRRCRWVAFLCLSHDLIEIAVAVL